MDKHFNNVTHDTFAEEKIIYASMQTVQILQQLIRD